VTGPVWLTLELVTAIHARHLDEFGGASGIRDLALLRSALDRPRNKLAYDTAPMAALAASYAFGIVKNHPFADGNKRTAFLAMMAFLGLNGVDFDAPDAEVIVVFRMLAAGEMSEEALALWISDRCGSPSLPAKPPS
jgi:death-on-curing protein